MIDEKTLRAMLAAAFMGGRHSKREMLDVVDAVLAKHAPHPAPAPAVAAAAGEAPPCGGSRCWQDASGAWIHSSKSYGTCSAQSCAPEKGGAR